jgi:hypothetical protein
MYIYQLATLKLNWFIYFPQKQHSNYLL